MTTDIYSTNPLTPAQAADVFDQAADLLETEGWTQFVGQNDEGERCVMGAVYEIIDRNKLLPYLAISGVLSGVLSKALRPAGASLFPRIVQWNDEPGRTKFEVIDHLRTVAKDLRNQEENQ